MARGFPLAGLLRLRKIQQDTASAAVARANAKLLAHDRHRSRVRAELGGHTMTPADSSALLAVAAARSSTSSMLAELDAAREIDLAALRTADLALREARVKAVGLEKLEQKHLSTLRADDLRVEQSALDELAGTAWHRTRLEGTP